MSWAWAERAWKAEIWAWPPFLTFGAFHLSELVKQAIGPYSIQALEAVPSTLHSMAPDLCSRYLSYHSAAFEVRRMWAVRCLHAAFHAGLRSPW